MSKRQVKKEQRDRIEAWRKDAETLSYEEAIQALDLLLAELQNDSVPLADLQQKVLHGEVYLSRCQSLHSFFVAQSFGILSPRFDAITVLFADLVLAHQVEVLGALCWI